MHYTILSNLNQSSAHIKASAIVSKGGVVIAFAPQHDDDDLHHLGAMSAAMPTIRADIIGKWVGEPVLINSADGYILMTGAGRDTALVVITHPHTAPDETLLVMQESAWLLLIHTRLSLLTPANSRSGFLARH
jgi:predicted regulator of Ras-like GTPase activity (Roadblock/LC7/MglB family)